MQITLNDLLYDLVNNHGLTVDVIADNVNVQPETVSKWLSGTKIPGEVSLTALLNLYRDENQIEDSITLNDDVPQTDVHHASAESKAATEPEKATETDTTTNSQEAAGTTNNEPEDTTNMADKNATDQDQEQPQEGQSIRSKASVFFSKPAVRNTGKALVGMLALGAAAYGGAVTEKRRGANTPV